MKTFFECFKAFRSSSKHQAEWFCDYGMIEFFVDGDDILIKAVYINDSEQRKGHFTNFIHELLKSDVKIIGVLGVTTFEMFDCLHKMMEDGIPFVDHGGDFIIDRKDD